MKRFYTLALASLTMLSASATVFNRAHMAPRANYTALAAEKSMSVTGTRALRAPARIATDAETVEGLDIWNCYGMLNNAFNGQLSLEVSIKVDDAATGATTIDLEGYTLSATFDAETGTLSIPTMQKLGTDEDGDYYFYTKSFANDDEMADGFNGAANAVGTWNGTSISFDPDEVWAIGDPDQESLGWYILSCENVFTTDNSVAFEGKFNDNLVYPAFNEGKENTEITDVTVTTNGGSIYTVKDPLQAIYKVLEIDGVSPDLEIDASDPENVVVPAASTGLGNGSNLYLYFNEAWWCDNFGGELDDALRCTMTVDEDHNVTITFPYHSTTLWLYPTNDGFYYGSTFESKLTFRDPDAPITNGVKAISADSNAPVRFYNLQGMEVSNPQAGSFVIRVQGSQAVKEIAK